MVNRSLKHSRAHYNAYESVQGHAWHACGCAMKRKQAQTRADCDREPQRTTGRDKVMLMMQDFGRGL